MPATQQQDAGLVQRGLLLLGGMTALVVVMLLVALRRPESSNAPASTAKDVAPSAPGWEIRYNAALALARRGSPNTPWPIILEMLDEDRQQSNFRVTLKNGQVVADVEDARNTVRNALSAVAQWHEKQSHTAPQPPTAEMQLVYDQIDRLAHDTNAPLRVHADRTRQKINRQ
jgi:hypothetical protein